MRTKTVLALTFTIFFTMLFVGWAGTRIYNAVDFGRDIGGHLKRAANANTIDIAKKELKYSLNNIEAQGLTYGYTSILWQTPSEDLEFWYQNTKASYDELSAVSDNASQLEKTNILMKLRESLMDGEDVVIPDGVSVYPSNGGFALWGFGSGILTIIFGIWFLYRLDNDY